MIMKDGKNFQTLVAEFKSNLSELNEAQAAKLANLHFKADGYGAFWANTESKEDLGKAVTICGLEEVYKAVNIEHPNAKWVLVTPDSEFVDGGQTPSKFIEEQAEWIIRSMLRGNGRLLSEYLWMITGALVVLYDLD
jgi:hypothetical protein